MTLPRLLASVTVSTLAAFGQAQSTSGDLRGTVIDPSGASVAKAKITVSEPERAITRTAVSGDDGEFTVPLLPPGTYRLRAESPGFTTRIVDGISVRVGDTVSVHVAMQVGQVATEVQVTAETPVIEPERHQQANTIEQARIRNLPINRRNYLDFVLLAPGTADTSDMVDNSDFRVSQTPQSGISFGGGNGRGNGFFIDGVENYINCGGVRASVSQEAVQEFQINRNSASSEFGGGFGGTINIITKSGTNDIHGNVFGFLRHKDIQARNYFDPGKSAFTRSQAGATIGGPLIKDRTFYFGAFERLDRQETIFVPILQDRSAFNRLTTSQQELIDVFNASGVAQLRGLAAQASQLLTPANNPRVVSLFNRNSGNFPFSEDVTMLSAKLDHRFSDTHSFFVRGNYTDSLTPTSQFGALVAYSRSRSVGVQDGTVMLNDAIVLSPRWVVETRGMFNFNSLKVQPVDPFGPEINITGFGFFGRDIFLPSLTYERHYQAVQNWTYNSGRHGVKFGWDINPVRVTVLSDTFFSGRFGFGEAIPLANVLAAATGDPNFPATVAQILTQLGQSRLIPNLSQPINSLQAFGLGLPTFYQQGFGDNAWIGWSHRYNFFLQDSWKIAPNFTLNTGVRYELERNEQPIGTDPNNIAPRFGFAWTPHARTVIRGGYGIYFSQTNLQVPNVADTLSGSQINQVLVPITGLSFITNPRTGRPLTSSDIYQTLLAQGVVGSRQIRASDLAQFGLQPAPGLPGRVVFGAEPGYKNPYSQQASFEVEQAVGDFAVSAAYNFNRGVHMPRILGRNLFYSGRQPDGRPTFGRIDPTVLQRNNFDWSANSIYHAGILQVTKRFSNHFSLSGHYTFSKAIDDTVDFNSDFSPHDQLNARAERALSSFHHSHRVVFNAVIESPYRNAWTGGWVLAPIVQWNSWRPFNVLTGVDILNDGYTTNKRPHKAGRNIGQGPDFTTFDLRLSRKVVFGGDGRRNIEFIADGFNLLNRTNFRSVNNTVGNVTLESLPNPLVGRRGVPTEPLSFTSAYDPRQFQFGVKVNF